MTDRIGVAGPAGRAGGRRGEPLWVLRQPQHQQADPAAARRFACREGLPGARLVLRAARVRPPAARRESATPCCVRVREEVWYRWRRATAREPALADDGRPRRRARGLSLGKPMLVSTSAGSPAAGRRRAQDPGRRLRGADIAAALGLAVDRASELGAAAQECVARATSRRRLYTRAYRRERGHDAVCGRIAGRAGRPRRRRRARTRAREQASSRDRERSPHFCHGAWHLFRRPRCRLHGPAHCRCTSGGAWHRGGAGIARGAWLKDERATAVRLHDDGSRGSGSRDRWCRRRSAPAADGRPGS